MTIPASQRGRFGSASAALLLTLAVVAASTAQSTEPCPLELDERGTPIGWVLYQGDIQVPEGFLDGDRATYEPDLWTNGEIPYAFDSNTNSTQQGQAIAAMAIWENVANVNFRPREFWELTYLHIRDSSNDPEPSNSSPVGMGVGPRIVNLVDWTWQFRIAHEFGHSLGYWHEQSRVNRDDFVTIEWDNIEDGAEHNFDIEIFSRDYPPGGYDFDSVMHYSACAFSTCGQACGAHDPTCRTITVKPQYYSDWQDNIGQFDHLSYFDALVMSFLYPESDWVFVDQDYGLPFPNGTFDHPYPALTTGIDEVPTGGTIWVQPGTYNANGLLTKGMTVRAPIGNVLLQ
jgi:hypothetical protein